MGIIKETVSKDREKTTEKKEEMKSKYEQALDKYNLNITDEQVKAAVQKIIDEKVEENDTVEVKKFLFGSVELTSLSTTEDRKSVV